MPWGQSDNQISPLGTFTDSFDTNRWLARAKVEGVFVAGDWGIAPNLALTYFSETQKSYTDTPGNIIGGQKISLGELTFGPELARTFALSNGNGLRPKLGLAGVWNFDVNQGATTVTTSLWAVRTSELGSTWALNCSPRGGGYRSKAIMMASA